MLQLPQTSSASRRTASQTGFLLLSQGAAAATTCHPMIAPTAQEGDYVPGNTVNWPVCKFLTANLLLGFWLWINFAAPIAVSIVSRQD